LLVANLLSAFNNPNPITNNLFKNVPEINQEGIENILLFYETGKLHFQKVLTED
ncbi:6717_t:CDS:1, partial [Gigaspora rosea]